MYVEIYLTLDPNRKNSVSYQWQSLVTKVCVVRQTA